MKLIGTLAGVIFVAIGLYMLHPGLPVIAGGCVLVSACHERRACR